jgi:hypothetical protein
MLYFQLSKADWARRQTACAECDNGKADLDLDMSHSKSAINSRKVCGKKRGRSRLLKQKLAEDGEADA